MSSTAASAPAAADAQRTGDRGGINPTLKSALRVLALFFGVQFLMNNLFGKKSPDAVVTKDASGAIISTGTIPAFPLRPETLDEGAMYNPIPQKLAPMWPLDSSLDLTIVVSPSYVHEPLANVPKDRKVLEEKGFKLGNSGDKRSVDAEFAVPEEVQRNGTLWGLFYIGLEGSILDPAVAGFDSAKAYHYAYPLTQYISQKKVVKTKNLLAGTEEYQPGLKEPSGPVIVSHYHPNFTMSFIPDTGLLNYPSLHLAVRKYVHPEATKARDGTGQNGWYYPVLFVNSFWQLKSHMRTLNTTVERLPMHIDLNNLANWKFSIISSIDEGSKQTAKAAAEGVSTPGGGDGSEVEMMKEILLDTNIYLLGTTAAVSILHMIFEMLAFKSDVSHFRNKKNNVGISVRSILANVFMQSVILLYLLDNNENTSWIILFSQGLGVAVELWKITTVVNIRIRPSANSLGYKLAFEDKHKLSETEQRTKEYDEIAFKYLYMIAVPLLLAYAGYSLKYQSHKSWYSFVIATLVGSVYAYGFLMMIPSLYINYRLKSVAHMPARAMMYKFLNTFIDDLFAFTIKMPLLHRLATLRDDVIFFVYLWQSWKYKVDYNRVNEFGQGGEEEQLEEKTANEPLKAVPASDASQRLRADNSGDTQEQILEPVSVSTGSQGREGKATKRR